jgi:hypothetical protein
LDYRNIDRSLVLNKALRKFAKRNFPLKPSELYILRAIAQGNTSNIAIQDYLKGFYRTYHTGIIANILNRFIALKIVTKTGVKYSLSFAGEAALKEIETLIRTTRIDK